MIRKMTQFRFYRGSFRDSMETTVPASSMRDLQRILGTKEFTVEPYAGVDPRNGWNTHIVTLTAGGMEGWTDGVPVLNELDRTLPPVEHLAFLSDLESKYRELFEPANIDMAERTERMGAVCWDGGRDAFYGLCSKVLPGAQFAYLRVAGYLDCIDLGAGITSFKRPEIEYAYLCWSIGFARGLTSSTNDRVVDLSDFCQFYKHLTNSDSVDSDHKDTELAKNAWCYAYALGIGTVKGARRTLKKGEN